MIEADNSSVIAAYEKKIAELDSKKLVLREKMTTQGTPSRTYDELFERALQFLANPWKIWSSGDLHLRRLVLRLAFAERIPYRRGSGFSNVKTALPFRMLGPIAAGEILMARLDGETSNALFETLSDWNIALKDHNLNSLPGPPCP